MLHFYYSHFYNHVGKFPLDGEKSLSDVRNMIHKLYSSLNVGQLQVCARVPVCGIYILGVKYYNTIAVCNMSAC